jgi:hypothetical protein
MVRALFKETNGALDQPSACLTAVLLCNGAHDRLSAKCESMFGLRC